MEPSPAQRRELGAFLRARRQALPAPALGRRRTPGLRREEVAALSGVSTTWYVWAEQGRDISLSPQALARLAGALQLAPAARAYLFTLAGRLDPASPPKPQTISPELRLLPASISAPAYVLDALYNACSWNQPAQTLFTPWAESREPNLLRFVFLQPAARSFIQDWPSRAERLVAEFRAESAQMPDSPARSSLLNSLTSASADFARLWAARNVLAREGGARRFLHPTQGTLRYTQHNFMPMAHPGYKLVVLTKLV